MKGYYTYLVSFKYTDKKNLRINFYYIYIKENVF